MFTKHPILVVDDDESALYKIKNSLIEQGLDAVGNKDLQDYRLVERFGIVVSDINGIGSVNTAKALLEKIKEVYPYKIIIPIFAKPTKIALRENLILKDDEEVYVSTIVKRVKECQDSMNMPKKYYDGLIKAIPVSPQSKAALNIKQQFSEYLSSLNKY